LQAEPWGALVEGNSFTEAMLDRLAEIKGKAPPADQVAIDVEVGTFSIAEVVSLSSMALSSASKLTHLCRCVPDDRSTLNVVCSMHRMVGVAHVRVVY
jgi:hypothetical protein